MNSYHYDYNALEDNNGRLVDEIQVRIVENKQKLNKRMPISLFIVTHCNLRGIYYCKYKQNGYMVNTGFFIQLYKVLLKNHS